MDEKDVKKALDSFENDDFITAKEVVKDVVKQAKNEYLKNKLGLSKDIEKPKQKPAEDKKKK
jgi:Tfp pilus assembly protein PilF